MQIQEDIPLTKSSGSRLHNFMCILAPYRGVKFSLPTVPLLKLPHSLRCVSSLYPRIQLVDPIELVEQACLAMEARHQRKQSDAEPRLSIDRQ